MSELVASGLQVLMAHGLGHQGLLPKMPMLLAISTHDGKNACSNHDRHLSTMKVSHPDDMCPSCSTDFRSESNHQWKGSDYSQGHWCEY